MASVLDSVDAIVGPENVYRDAGDMAPYLKDWRGQYRSQAMAVARPANTREVSELVANCSKHGVGIVPIGGNTGLVGGAVATKSQLLVSLERLSRIRAVDSLAATIAVDAGCILSDAQQAAEQHSLMLPLSLSAEGTCQIGGNISTGAGGLNVVRFGTVREQVLGLEVVLPDGAIFDDMRALRKDTAGYDLKQLFIGAEGTLGIVTGAVMRLYPALEKRTTLWLSVAALDDVLALFEKVRAGFGNLLTAFEYLSGPTMQIISQYLAQPTPLPTALDEHFVLIELAGSHAELDESSVLEQFSTWQTDGLLQATALASDGRQREAMWRLRHSASDAQRLAGTCIKHDIGLPASKISEFLHRIPHVIGDKIDGFQMFVFGHIGDGNLHFTVASAADSPRADLEAQRAFVNDAVHELVMQFGGTVSAEHGIGLLKRDVLGQQVGAMRLSLMRDIKRQFDPQGLMNPGKVL